MPDYNIKQAQTQDFPDRGFLGIQVSSSVGALPVENARVRVSYTGTPEQVAQVKGSFTGEYLKPYLK